MGNFLTDCKEGTEEGFAKGSDPCSPLEDSMYVTAKEKLAIQDLLRTFATRPSAVSASSSASTNTLQSPSNSNKGSAVSRKGILQRQSVVFNADAVHAVFRSTPFFADFFHNWLCGNIHDRYAFEDFIVNITRITTCKTIELLWDIIVFNDSIKPNERLNALYKILLELAASDLLSGADSREGNYERIANVDAGADADAGVHDKGASLGLDIDQITAVAERLTDFYATAQQRYNSQSDLTAEAGECSGRDIFGGLNLYAPFAAKVVESFFSVLCFRDHLSPAYKPFRPPKLSVASEICSIFDLIPLAMYNSMLQGYWQRLYSTSTDGLSFNRIVHHILGYDVRLLLRLLCCMLLCCCFNII